jgi:small subunit ribosomal protein S20
LIPGFSRGSSRQQTKKSFGGTTLANIRSQIKRNRQNEKRRLRNRNFRGAARTAVKDAQTALGSGADSAASVLAAISALDKAAQKGAIHPRNASRRKARLMKRLGATGTAAPKVAEKKPAARKTTAKKAVSKKSTSK